MQNILVFIIMFVLAFSNTFSQVVSSHWPMDGTDASYITSAFGSRDRTPGAIITYDWHPAIDIPSPHGTDIIATHSGSFETYGGSGENKWGVVDIGDGEYIRYWHIEWGNLSEDDPIVAGETVIGTITDYSYGDHLHYEYHPDTYSDNENALHPLRILSYTNSYNNLTIDGVVRSDNDGYYIQAELLTDANAPDFELIRPFMTAWTKGSDAYYEEDLLRLAYVDEWHPWVDFFYKYNCGENVSNKVYSNEEGLALEIQVDDFPTSNDEQWLNFKFYIKDRFVENPYSLDYIDQLLVDWAINDVSDDFYQYPTVYYEIPDNNGPVTFNPPPGQVIINEGEYVQIEMFSSISGDIYFAARDPNTEQFATSCLDLPDVTYEYAPYEYPGQKSHARLNAAGTRCIKAAVYTGGTTVSENVCGCWDVEVITGVNDYLNINVLTATGTLFEEGNYFYEAVFVDADNDGTTFNDYNWELKLFHSNGEYIYSSSNSGILTGNYDCLPDGYNWTLVNGKIQGEVVCYGYDSDGTYQEDTFPIEAEVANDCLIAPVISHFTQTPTTICQGSSGYVYVHLEQGSGTLN